jgi:trehalose synthase
VAGPLAEYEPIIGRGAVEELRVVADRVRHRSVQHVSATSGGGNGSENLARLVPLLQDLGVPVTWDVMKEDEAFSHAARALRDALHGRPETITESMREAYRATMELNRKETPLTGDVLFVHDPPPAGLVARREEIGRSWVWSCHSDLSDPDPSAWEFLGTYAERYDAAIFPAPEFAPPLSIPEYVFAPSIDPLSDRNRELPSGYVEKILAEHRLDPGRPILAQVSRFDRLENPLDVIEVYGAVKRRFDCQLVLAGEGDGREGGARAVLRELREAAEADPDVHVLDLPPFSDLEINALVRGATVVLQMPLREGFGLSVSEAQWKRKPVVGGATGGIKLQVVNGVTGCLVHSPEGAAQRVLRLLGDRGLRERMGENGYRHVLQNFLVTRQAKDYMLVLLALEHSDEDVVHLG